MVNLSWDSKQIIPGFEITVNSSKLGLVHLGEVFANEVCKKAVLFFRTKVGKFDDVVKLGIEGSQVLF